MKTQTLKKLWRSAAVAASLLAAVSWNSAFAAIDKSDLSTGKNYYVSSGKLNLRTSPEVTANNSAGTLRMNDEVKILDTLSSDSDFVQIEVVRSVTGAKGTFYVSAEFLSAEKKDVVVSNPSSGGRSGQYFAVQNVASERMRVYERCTSSPDCPHRLVMETEMVVGRPEGDDTSKYAFLTHLGSLKITDWVKYYRDNAQKYPSWYDPQLPEIPKKGKMTDMSTGWVGKKYCGDRDCSGRGAFGWFAAMLGPNAASQWLHGTYGWGMDGKYYIKKTRSFFINLVADPRSHGCTRVENQAIAYMRHILPVGTDLVRVYALEGYRDPSRIAYQNQTEKITWDWILTKDSVRKFGSSPDRSVQLSMGVLPGNILEEGTFKIDQYPDAMGLIKNAGKMSRWSGKSGNSYGIPDKNFRGVFLVDEGRFVNYEHPRPLAVSGNRAVVVPRYMVGSNNTSYAMMPMRTESGAEQDYQLSSEEEYEVK